MTKEQRDEQLDEVGREVADLSPGMYGAVIFDVKNGELAGVREELRRSPNSRGFKVTRFRVGESRNAKT